MLLLLLLQVQVLLYCIIFVASAIVHAAESAIKNIVVVVAAYIAVIKL